MMAQSSQTVGLEAPRDARYEQTAWWTSTALIMGVAVVLRVVALFLFEGEIHDGISRVGIAAGWFFDGIPTFGRTTWPEGNYVLPGIALAIWREPYWSPRILFALVALTNIWLVIKVTHAALDRRSAAVAGWIVALMPFHIVISADHAMSEAPYVSLLLASMWMVIRWREHPRLSLALWAGFFLTLAVTFRIDGVFWGLPLAASFVLLRQRGRFLMIDVPTIRDMFAFGIVGLMYPLGLVAYWFRIYDNPWTQLDEAKLNTLQFFAGGGHPRWPAWLYQTYVVGFWPASTFIILTPVIGLLAWLGMAAVIKKDATRALPLWLGVLVIMAWLGYAASAHTILAQWRYSLILAIALSAFFVSGVRAVRSVLPRVPATAITALALAAALVCQAVITDASFHDRGTLSRQFTLLSPIRPDQFATRELLKWASANSTPDRPLLVTPHLVESPYFALHRSELEKSGKLIVQSYYLPKSQLVHTHKSLTDELHEKLGRVQWVATSTGLRELGLRDDMVRELVVPTGSDSVKTWDGARLRQIQEWGNVRLWEVVR